VILISQLDKPRETALIILNDITSKEAYLNIALNNHLKNSEFGTQDRAFITELVYGVIKWQLTLDYIISLFSKIKLSKMSQWILNILRLGVYQIIFMDRVPESAACNECVKLSKRYGHKASSNFVNAVLRNVARNKNNIEYPDPNKDTIKYLSVKYSHPEWLVKYWTKWLGREFTENLLDANNNPPELTIRTNTLKTNPSELIARMNSEGVEAIHGKYVEDALILKGTVSVADLKAHKTGLFQVQDESSMLAVRILDPQPGENVADLCSAPGGKTAYIAQLMKNRGMVLARDVHPQKVKLVRDAASLLGIDIVKTEVFDSTVFDETLKEKFDRVLVDAPCTGLGIIRRKADIKWRRKPEDLESLRKIQIKILDNAARYVKPGGVIVYSTCTIQKDENQGVVEAFLNEHPEFEKESLDGYIPASLAGTTTKQGFVQVFPHVHQIDGFFIARFRRSR